MSKRAITVAFFAVITATAALAASDESCTRETLKPVGAPQHINIATLFEKNDEMPLEGMEVLVARIAPDGKAVMACVDSAEAAKKFFEAPIEKTGRAAKEK